MKKIIKPLILLLMLSMFCSGEALARRRHHTHTHLSFGFGPYWSGYPYYSYPYHSYPYYPVIIDRPAAPVIYIEKSAPSVAPPAPNQYWYYCEAAKGYYPYVQNCPTGWMKVVPQAPATAPR